MLTVFLVVFTVSVSAPSRLIMKHKMSTSSCSLWASRSEALSCWWWLQYSKLQVSESNLLSIILWFLQLQLQKTYRADGYMLLVSQKCMCISGPNRNKACVVRCLWATCPYWGLTAVWLTAGNDIVIRDKLECFCTCREAHSVSLTRNWLALHFLCGIHLPFSRCLCVLFGCVVTPAARLLHCNTCLTVGPK